MRMPISATHALELNQKGLRRLFARIRGMASTPSPRKADVFAAIKRSIRTQMAVEAEMLYPSLSGRPSPEAGAAFDGLLQRHFGIEERLGRLSALEPGGAGFDAGVRALEEEVATYFREVRRGPYRQARRQLSRRRLERLGEQIRARMDLALRPALGE